MYSLTVLGLSLELFLEQDEYVPDVTEAAGVRVVVHEHHTTAQPHDQGLFVSPSGLTSLAVKMVFT